MCKAVGHRCDTTKCCSCLVMWYCKMCSKLSYAVMEGLSCTVRQMMRASMYRKHTVFHAQHALDDDVDAQLCLAGLDSFPADWPDANLTENDNFLNFVDCAVRQSLEPYRPGHGHNGLLVCIHHNFCLMLHLGLPQV